MGSKKHCLVIGYGSIGKRHCRLLHQLGFQVGVVTAQDIKTYKTFPDIKTALADKRFDYAVVCNATSDHLKSIQDLEKNRFKGVVLVEKPLFHKEAPLSDLPFDLFVGYNLRFHPLLQKVYDLVKERTIYSIHAYCGQHLSTWRPDTDYRDSYSAFPEKGGGVLNDLSHELDYIQWLAGNWKTVAAIGGKVSDLEIQSDDVFSLLLETQRCPAVTLQVNYLDTIPARQLLINAQGICIKADLIEGSLSTDNEMLSFNVDRDETYTLQHKAVIHRDKKMLAGLKQGLETVSLIQAAKKASKEKIWITNPK